MFMPDDKEITLRGVNSASFSADGRRLVTAGIDRTARVWDAKSGAALVVLKGQNRRRVQPGRQTHTDSIR
jgi:WD40 repeat protein